MFISCLINCAPDSVLHMSGNNDLDTCKFEITPIFVTISKWKICSDFFFLRNQGLTV